MSESKSGKSPKISLADLGIMIAMPGILTLIFYYAVDHGYLLPQFRSPMKQWVDENFLIYVSFVFPSMLLFLGCGIFKVMHWANPSPPEEIAKRVRWWLMIVWACVVLWSVLSLFLFRSTASHGPDRVGSEVAGFVLPLSLAALLSLGFANAHTAQPARFKLLIATAVIALLEIAIYSFAICP